MVSYIIDIKQNIHNIIQLLGSSSQSLFNSKIVKQCIYTFAGVTRAVALALGLLQLDGTYAEVSREAGIGRNRDCHDS